MGVEHFFCSAYFDLVTPIFGQSFFKKHFEQVGVGAWQWSRPNWISLWDRGPQFFLGICFIRSCSIFSGVLFLVRLVLCVILLMWVSTTKPSFFPNMFQRITFAVFRPTPGRVVSSLMLFGSFLLKFWMRVWAQFFRDFDFVRKNPRGWRIFSRSVIGLVV